MVLLRVEPIGNSNPSVLVICAVDGHGGPIQSIQSVLRHLRPSGLQATVATQEPASSWRSIDSQGLVDNVVSMVRPRGIRLLRAQLALLAARREIRRTCSVIHANGLTEAAVALPLALCTRLPVVVWVHNAQRPRPYQLVEPLLRIFGRRWTFLAVSQTAKALVRVANCHIVPNPIDDDHIASELQPSGSFRVTYLAGSDRFYKGFDLLPDIIRETRCQNIIWTIYTSPPYSSREKPCRMAWDRLISSPSPAIRIRSRVEDVREALADTDLILAPSRLESFNRVIAEALASGIPVVASDLPPHRELVGLGGSLFPSGDYARAAQEIDRFCDHRMVYEAAVAAAREMRDAFDVRVVAESIKAFWSCSADSRPH